MYVVVGLTLPPSVLDQNVIASLHVCGSSLFQGSLAQPVQHLEQVQNLWLSVRGGGLPTRAASSVPGASHAPCAFIVPGGLARPLPVLIRRLIPPDIVVVPPLA